MKRDECYDVIHEGEDEGPYITSTANYMKAFVCNEESN